MKSLQLFALVLGLGLAPVYAQQEVAPDHFDQAPSQAAVQQAHGSQSSAKHQRQRNHATLASNHAGKAHHHHARTA